MSKLYTLENMKFDNWVVLYYVGGSKWMCRCSCGIEKTVRTNELVTGKSKSCGHNKNKLKDLSDKQFGELRVINYADNRYWNCICSCNKKLKVHGYALTSGHTKSCGHSTNAFKDIKGFKFGNWEVLEYVGNSTWSCRCLCGTIRNIHRYTLINGESKSCGCNTVSDRETTTTSRYGYKYYEHSISSREDNQIFMVANKENMEKAITEKFDYKPTSIELANLFSITSANVLKKIHKFELEDLITLGKRDCSSYETEIKQLFTHLKQSDRKVLNGYELDLIDIENRVAIEFNGDYWHSSICKDSGYHQWKTVEAYKKGIRLIHIFEYEWNNEDKRNKIINMLNIIFNKQDNYVVYARKCDVGIIECSEAKKFLSKYHLDKCGNSIVNIGIYYEKEIIAVMTFDKTEKAREWILNELAYKNNTIVVGGIGKLFKYFVKKYRPKNVTTYIDIAKFTGNSYLKLGFKSLEITPPDYVWKDIHSLKIMHRHSSDAENLIRSNLVVDGQTEEQVMEYLDYCKIYNSGSIKLFWETGDLLNE